MELSLEIPTPHIEDFLPLTDFAFGLAQLYLRSDYPNAGKYQKLYQRCLLDNGMYELGEPLPIDELVHAVWYCNPVSVIAPDWMDRMSKTIDAAFELRGALRGECSVGAVVQGKNLDERLECFRILQTNGFSPICFPFRTPRDQTIGHLALEHRFRDNEWYHLLGLQHLRELRWKFPGRWSVDTGKPFKGYWLDKVKNIRGLGRLDLFKELTEANKTLAYRNIAVLRRYEHV
ncbi:MAG: hypothetical protein ACTSXC_07880 [Candidatus Freyarchaeota archaeon]